MLSAKLNFVVRSLVRFVGSLCLFAILSNVAFGQAERLTPNVAFTLEDRIP